MTAKGKINASKVQVGDRILVQVNRNDAGLVRYVGISSTKTGEGVMVARVTGKTSYTTRGNGFYGRSQRVYVVQTSVGEFNAAPIETMWLAPEDNAGIKRAWVEALAEDEGRMFDRTTAEEIAARADEKRWNHGNIIDMEAEAHRENAQREMDETTANQATPQYRHFAEVTRSAGGYRNALDALHAEALAEDSYRESEAALADDAAKYIENITSPVVGDLTLQSHDGKVTGMTNEETQTETLATTGSAVVTLLEKVWARIRENHPQLPEVVIVTGSGLVGDNKWGHFRANGWTAKNSDHQETVNRLETGGVTRMHELFMAGETLAKGARQVLQTMLHEGAHTLAKVREIQDTSRQGRWHNAKFKDLAKEMGLEYRGTVADKALGFSNQVLTADTLDEYRDLLDRLDTEIHLMVSLPGWLGGTDGEENGGEQIGTKPRTTEPSTTNLKLTCLCEEPNIIRASKKVAAKAVINCGDCDALFEERS